MKGGEKYMNILKDVSKKEMERSLENEAKQAYSVCSDDCPRCRVSDG